MEILLYMSRPKGLSSVALPNEKTLLDVLLNTSVFLHSGKISKQFHFWWSVKRVCVSWPDFSVSIWWMLCSYSNNKSFLFFAQNLSRACAGHFTTKSREKSKINRMKHVFQIVKCFIIIIIVVTFVLLAIKHISHQMFIALILPIILFLSLFFCNSHFI